jgi:hypothetical protein
MDLPRPSEQGYLISRKESSEGRSRPAIFWTTVGQDSDEGPPRVLQKGMASVREKSVHEIALDRGRQRRTTEPQQRLGWRS